MAAIRHLGLVWAYLDHSQIVLDGLYHCAKFGCDRCSNFDNMNDSIFGTFGLKTFIRASKVRILGKFD